MLEVEPSAMSLASCAANSGSRPNEVREVRECWKQLHPAFYDIFYTIYHEREL